MRLELDSTKFNACIIQLAKLTGQDLSSVVEAEVAAILQKTLSRTVAAKAGSIRSNYEKRKWTTFRGQRVFIHKTHSPEVAAGLAAQQKEGIKRRLQRRGLSKQTWLHLARAVGVTISAPGYVSKANVNGHTNAGNVRARKGSPGVKFFIEVTNAGPSVDTPGAKGRSALESAIKGRVKFFETNLKKGVFDEISKVARAYPGLVLR